MRSTFRKISFQRSFKPSSNRNLFFSTNFRILCSWSTLIRARANLAFLAKSKTNRLILKSIQNCSLKITCQCQMSWMELNWFCIHRDLNKAGGGFPNQFLCQSFVRNVSRSGEVEIQAKLIHSYVIHIWNGKKGRKSLGWFGSRASSSSSDLRESLKECNFVHSFSS